MAVPTSRRRTGARVAPPPALLGPDAVAAAVDDEAPFDAFHLRALVASGLGFFTDAYDLFIIGTAAALVQGEWRLSTTDVSLVSSATLLASFLGAVVLGRLADRCGRRRIYRLVAVIMVLGAIASALAPDLPLLIASRLVLGFGIGGDYPVSAVLMSELSGRHHRGRLVGLLFSMQAAGLIVGPIVGMTLLAAGTGTEMAWRLMLGLGALPAGAAIYFRRRIPESPRFARAAERTGGQAPPKGARSPLRDRRLLLLLVGTAGSWFAFDYAYYGNTISTPIVLRAVDPGATMLAKLAWSLIVFVVAALPGYVLAFARMDRFGHRRLQLTGFAVMAGAFLVAGAVPGVVTNVAPFLVCYGLSYFFAEFGPNTTTFVLPSELFPTRARTTGHGISAGVAKLGACAGVFAVPLLIDHLGLRGSLLCSAGAAALGMLCTLLLPEPAGRSLEELAGEPGLEPPAEEVASNPPHALVGTARR